jgi:hypothetical protein
MPSNSFAFACSLAWFTALGAVGLIAGGCTAVVDNVSNPGASGMSSGGSTGGGGGGQGGSGGPLSCESGISIPPRLYRLSTEQFSNAVRDLLKLPVGPKVGGDTEAVLTFYPRVDAPVQPGLASGFSTAVRAGLDAADLGALSGCVGAADAHGCAQAFIADFAARAYRRPLEQADKDALYAAPTSPFAVGAAVSVDNGLRLALEAILQAPSFVYRRELAATPDQRLDSFETATQLAFLLGDSVPDAELWQAAQAGQLVTDEQIGAAVERMLGRPEVQASVTRIVGAWFGVEKVLAASKDPKAYPGFNEQKLQDALLESVNRFIADSLWTGNGSLQQLLTSPRIFLNGPLSAAFGVSFTGAAPTDFMAFEQPNERAGIMTQPALLAALSSSLDTSVVKRGLFVMGKALCLGHPPSPPAGVLGEVQKQLEDETTTERQKAEYRALNTCKSCHWQFDPYGLALETYDAIGRFRTTDKNGAPINASSEMSEAVVLAKAAHTADADDMHPVNGPLEFVNGVAQTDVFALCGNQQMLSYAIGREVDESCVDHEGVSLNMSIKDIFRKIVLSDAMRKRAAGAF